MFIIIFIIVCVINNCSCEYNISDDNNNTLICGSSKFVNRCVCKIETDDIINLPLLVVDCSRIEFSESPNQNILPISIGRLDLSHNKIEQLNDTTKLNSTTLHHLDYSYNQIQIVTDGYFNELTNLINLNLEHNKLKNINIGFTLGLTNLLSLNLARNLLKDIPKTFFNNIQKLEEINLGYNNLEEFFSNITTQILPRSLKYLYLDEINLNNVEETTFSGLENIKRFTIINNPIRAMPVLHFENLEYLDISGIDIRTIRAKHLNFTSLKVLKMRRLKHLSEIGDFAFYNSSNLEELIIEDCKELKEIDSTTFGFLHLNATNRFRLKKLSLVRNNLRRLPANFEGLFRQLDVIDLGNNPWGCDCSIMWFTNLNNLKNPNNSRCNSPVSVHNKIISTLDPSDFVCLENRNANTGYISNHNWLFPVVGALSVIVLILVGLLIYMGPFNNYITDWSRSIGPESPYNRMTICDNEETSRHL